MISVAEEFANAIAAVYGEESVSVLVGGDLPRVVILHPHAGHLGHSADMS